ncbi:MAG: hypothetical protein RTU30_01495 [Candidatus Thorarchaeota archaeon]
MSDVNDQVLLKDCPPYDATYIRVGGAMVIVILGPVLFLIAYSEPVLIPLSIGLVVLIPLIVVGAPYTFGVPARVVVDKSGAKVRHGLVTIRMPAGDISQVDIQNPPWWLSIWYLFPDAQWVRIRKSRGLLKWWYFPATNAVKFIDAVKEIMR